MKHLKLFFALFAMLALGVGNAWGAEIEMSTFTATAADMDSYISYSTAKGGGTSNPAVNGGAIRLYQNSSGNAGGNITITAKNGATITEVTIGSSMGTSIRWEVNGAVDASNTSLSANGKVTKSDLSVSEIKCHCYGTSSSTRLYVNYLKVVYTTSSGETPEPDPDPTPDPGTGSTSGWVETAIGNISASDIVVVTMTNSAGTYAMSNDKGTGAAPTAVKVTVNGDKLSEEPADNLKWNITNSSGSLTIYPNGSTSTWLYCTNTNNGTRVGTNTSKTFSIDGTYLKHSGTSRYVGVYNSQDWRCYTSSSTNISGQTLKFYKYVKQSSEGGGSGETVSSLTQDQFSWSATTATATLPDQFDPKPTLTNTENLDVTYSSSNEDVAKIDASGNVTLFGKGETVISATAGDDETYKKTTVSYTLTVKPAPLAPIAGGVIDILNQDWTDVTGTNYTDVAAKTAENEGHSNAQYVAQCAGDKSSIQLRSNNNNSGVVSTISGGIVKRVEVEWQNETTAGRILQVYGSNTAYEAATDLYSDDKKGELLGEITMGGDETVVDYSQWTGDYKYIGLRSKSGAMYLTTITITWLPINSKVTIDDAIQNGSISVSGAADLNAVAAGTVLTLDNTPEAGYKFVKYNVYKTDEPTTEIDVENSKFTMPEYDVTVSATFTSIKELDKIEVNTTNVKKTFWQGEAFSSNGLEVTAYYTDGTSITVTPTNITGGNTANAGEITVTVSYTEGSNTKTTTYNITVKAIENNETTVYTVAQAREIIDAVGNTTVEVYVQGIVSKIVTAFNPTYGNISYDISADGLKTSDQLQAYHGFSYDGAWFTSADDIQVGDVVVVKGKLKIYNTTYELDEGNKLVSLVRSTEPKPTAATLPFEFDNGKADIENTPGMSQNGLGSDYGSAPLLKFDGTGDYVIIHFNGEPGKLSYDIKGNSYSDGTFTVQESEDGSAYTNIVEYTELGSTETKTHTLAATSRYVKFIYTEKVNGNVALGNIKIALPEEEPGEGGGETPEEPLTDWLLTPLADITTNDLVVITVTKGETTWAMTNDKGTTAAPVASEVTVTANALAVEPAENLKWVVSNDNGTLTIYPYGGYGTWLYSTTTNNGIRVGTSENKTFKIDDTYGYLYNIATDRYVGVYNNADWRSYTSMHANISDQTLAFFVKKNANDILPGTGEDPDEPGDDPVVPTPTINPTATFIFNTPEGLTNLGITYPTTADEDTEGAYKTDFEDGARYTQDDITMTTTNGGTPTRVWLTAAGKLDLRVYKNATLTFSVPAEHKISKVVFDGTNISHLLVNETAVSGNAWTGSAQTVTFTAKSDASTIKINTIAFVVEYTRDVTNTYGTICLPYASASTSGAYFYEVVGRGTENGKPAVYLASVNSLKAGVPYIFEKTDNQIKVVYTGEAVDAPQNGDANGLVGTFEEIEVPNGMYILYNNAFCTNKSGEVNKIRANRAYLNMDAVDGGAPQQMPGRRYIGMSVQGENEATGFENITAPAGKTVKAIVNGQLIIIRDGEMYNAQGVRF